MKPETSMWAGQSIGLGTRAGDQVYVVGILRVSRMKGASVVGSGRRSRVVRNALIMSPRLRGRLVVRCDTNEGDRLLDGGVNITHPCHVRIWTRP